MSKLRIGTSKVCISPTQDMFPYPGPNYLGGNVWVDGVYFDIYIRMIAISNDEETFLFGSFEESNGTEVLKEEISKRYGIPYKNQMFCQIHNHGGVDTPVVTNESRKKNSVHEYSEVHYKMSKLVFDKAIEAAGIALDNLKPAAYGYGEGESYINVNRDLPNDDGYWTQGQNFGGFSDKTLAVLKFVDEEGNLLAAILNYGAHAITTIGAKDLDGKYKVCGDFPGFTCDYLENKYQGAIVMWTTGAAGDQNAITCYMGEKHYKETCEVSVGADIPYGYQYNYSQFLGERHGVDADKVLNKIDACHKQITLHSAYTDVFIPQQKAPEGVIFWLQIAIAQNNVSVVEKIAPEMVQDGRIINRSLVDYIPTGTFEDCEMQLFVIGDMAIITVAAELYSKLGVVCKENSPYRNTFIITVAGGHGNRVGYIQDTESNSHKTFQHYGEAFPCDSNRIFTDGIKKLTAEIISF